MGATGSFAVGSFTGTTFGGASTLCSARCSTLATFGLGATTFAFSSTSFFLASVICTKKLLPAARCCAVDSSATATPPWMMIDTRTVAFFTCNTSREETTSRPLAA
jgi:hypothetical protein